MKDNKRAREQRIKKFDRALFKLVQQHIGSGLLYEEAQRILKWRAEVDVENDRREAEGWLLRWAALRDKFMLDGMSFDEANTKAGKIITPQIAKGPPS